MTTKKLPKSAMIMMMTRKVVEMRMVFSSNFSSIMVPLVPVTGAELDISN